MGEILDRDCSAVEDTEVCRSEEFDDDGRTRRTGRFNS